MLLSAEHISLNFGLKPLLDDVTLYLSQGDKVGLIGINGRGKSSFLRVLAGQQPPDQGSVTRDPNVQVCFLPQNPPMEAGATVLEQVFAGFSPDTRALLDYEAKAMLTRLGLTDFAQPVGTLSGGGLWLTAIGLSQVISNVPSTILLLNYVPPSILLAWAVNVGGFGLLPGSLANIIALRMASDRRIWWRFHLYSIPMLLWAALSGYWLFKLSA